MGAKLVKSVNESREDVGPAEGWGVCATVGVGILVGMGVIIEVLV